ncbi:hypothetical protein HY990_01855 [Candidatus Micrarchaeota archaeon]|nr:hypothetical protein [Candidatus Micrarchaeota archaeon]
MIENKQVWKNTIRTARSVFPYETQPRLLESINRKTPSDTRVILFGGGRGHLGTLITGRRRTFFNLDLCDPDQSVIPSLGIDLEVPLTTQAISLARGANDRASIIAPFSLDYMDIDRAKENLAALTRKGERIIVLCHPESSPIMEDLKKASTLHAMVSEVKERMDRSNTDLKQLFEQTRDKLLGVHPILPSDLFDADEVAQLQQMRATVNYYGSADILASLIDLVILIKLSSGEDRFVKEAKKRIESSLTFLEEQAAIAVPAIAKKFRSPEDIARALDSHEDTRFLLEERWTEADEYGPYCLVAIFERMDE